jgi:hypothetical protein
LLTAAGLARHSEACIVLDRQRMLNATFPGTVEVPTRFDDLDLQASQQCSRCRAAAGSARPVPRQPCDLVPGRRAAQAWVVGSLLIDYAGRSTIPTASKSRPASSRSGGLPISWVRSSGTRGQTVIFAEVILVTTEDGRATPINDELRAMLERDGSSPSPA